MGLSNMDNVDVRGLRERAGLTQSQLAEKLGIRQDEVSRLERNPSALTLQLFLEICSIFGISPNQATSFRPGAPAPLLVRDRYHDIRAERNLILNHLDKGREKLTEDPETAEAIYLLEQIVLQASQKPLVTLLGRSDSGKSRMINSIIGSDKLPTDWQPTTTIRVYVKHINDRPEWMKDEVIVFKSPCPGDQGWDYRLFYDERYCAEWELESGSAELLQKYGTREGAKEQLSRAEAAVVYVDAPVLQACDMMDLPGFATGDSSEEDAQAQRGREQADAIIYLSPANVFMHEEDIIFLKQVLRELPPLENRNESSIMPLANLFVVASHAHLADEDKLTCILDRAAERLFAQVPDDVWQSKVKTTGRTYDEDALRRRFYTYTLDDAFVRVSLEDDLKSLLEGPLAEMGRKKFDKVVGDVIRERTDNEKLEIARLQSVLADLEMARKQLAEQEKEYPRAMGRIREAKKDVYAKISELSDRSAQEFSEWFVKEIAIEKIEAEIRSRYTSAKDAGKLIGGNVNDWIVAKTGEILRSGTEELEGVLGDYFEVFEQEATALTKIDVPGFDVPFDVKGALRGGLAGATALGALSVWASAVGNLGGYILLAKGVSLLAAMGIHVGGTAAAASALAAMGGPITLGIALALGVGLTVKGLFGEKWQTRLARQVMKMISDDKIMDKYLEEIAKYWRDTEQAFRKATDNAERKLKDKLESLRRLVEAEDPQIIEDALARAEERKDFFEAIPWKAGA